ncbi:hypothetical protein B0H16DRAFT_1568896 [Mycena metata]|uniref:Secreted protein n=1 Tax=Mycena metata TaxID=1033252 RepID=A0AAD7IBI6_9AGAR|nr:hypothetical protein B0H16DRAFT_1568896 [Mycena metata]
MCRPLSALSANIRITVLVLWSPQITSFNQHQSVRFQSPQTTVPAHQSISSRCLRSPSVKTVCTFQRPWATMDTLPFFLSNFFFPVTLISFSSTLL